MHGLSFKTPKLGWCVRAYVHLQFSMLLYFSSALNVVQYTAAQLVILYEWNALLKTFRGFMLVIRDVDDDDNKIVIIYYFSAAQKRRDRTTMLLLLFLYTAPLYVIYNIFETESLKVRRIPCIFICVYDCRYIGIIYGIRLIMNHNIVFRVNESVYENDRERETDKQTEYRARSENGL